MKRCLVRLGFVAAMALGPGPARAELFQLIRVNVFSPEVVKVEGRPVKMSDLTAAIAALVTGEERVRVEILIPTGMDRAARQRLMDACRQAGATSLKVVQEA